MTTPAAALPPTYLTSSTYPYDVCFALFLFVVSFCFPPAPPSSGLLGVVRTKKKLSIVSSYWKQNIFSANITDYRTPNVIAFLSVGVVWYVMKFSAFVFHQEEEQIPRLLPLLSSSFMKLWTRFLVVEEENKENEENEEENEDRSWCLAVCDDLSS